MTLHLKNRRRESPCFSEQEHDGTVLQLRTAKTLADMVGKNRGDQMSAIPGLTLREIFEYYGKKGAELPCTD